MGTKRREKFSSGGVDVFLLHSLFNFMIRDQACGTFSCLTLFSKTFFLLTGRGNYWTSAPRFSAGKQNGFHRYRSWVPSLNDEHSRVNHVI